MARLSFQEIDAQLGFGRPSFEEIDRSYGFDALGEWEDASPTVQRRRKPGGGWEYRPKQIPGAAPGLGRVATPDTSSLAIAREALGVMGSTAAEANLVIAAAPVGVAGLLDKFVERGTRPIREVRPRSEEAERLAVAQRLRRAGAAPGSEIGEALLTASLEPALQNPLAGPQEMVAGWREGATRRLAAATSGLSENQAAAIFGAATMTGLALDASQYVGARAARPFGGALETAGQRTLRKAVGREAAEEIAPRAASGRPAGAIAGAVDQSAFQLKDGRIVPTGPFHDLDRLPEGVGFDDLQTSGFLKDGEYVPRESMVPGVGDLDNPNIVARMERQRSKAPPGPRVAPVVRGPGGTYTALGPDELMATMPKGDYFYHSTAAPNLAEVRQSGLRPGRVREGEISGVYLAEDGLSVHALVPRRRRAGDVFLRVRRRDVETQITDIYEPGSGFEEHVSPLAIPPEKLEVLESDGVWRPLQAPAVARQKAYEALPKAAGQEGSVGTGPLGSLRDWWTENFTGGGPSAGKYKIAARELGGKATPEGRFALSIPKRIEAMEGRQAVPVGRARDLVAEVTPLVKKAAPSKAGQRALFEDMQKAVTGEIPLDSIPEPLRPYVSRRQDLVEALQQRGIASGAFPDDMVEAITKSGGAYTHRSYQAFDDPRWIDRVRDTPDWYAAKSFLAKEMPNASEDEVLGIMMQLAKREQGTTALTVAQAPTRLNRILRERQNLPEPIRRLMGEYTDFRAVTEKTVYQMAHDIEAHNFWKEVGEDGLAAGAFRKAEQGPTETIFRRIPGSNAVEGISSRGPVEGLLSPEALKEALVGQFEMQKTTGWNRFAAAVNIGKTVGGFPTGHLRNFYAHHVTSAVNGKNPALVYTSGKRVAEAFRNPVMKDRMVELGIAGQGASSQEIFDFARILEEQAASPLARGWGKVGRKLGKSWGAGDDVWRAAHWFDETDQLAWANPTMSRPEVEALAADRVRDTFQTYSRAPEYARKLRRTPFGGPGVTFHAESLRNVKNIAKVAAGDIAAGIRTQNPRMVVLGLRRAVGLMAAPVAVASIPAASRMMSGMDREAQEAARRQAEPYYHQNAEQLILDFKPGESFSYVDVSFLNPYSALSKTAIATQRAVTQGQPPVEAVAEFLDQVTGGDIATKELLQLALNQPIKTMWPLRTYDTQIGNFDEGAPQATSELAYHAYRGLAPGGVVQLENVARGAGALPQREEGRERSLGTELPAYAGFRVTTQKIPDALRRNLGAIGARVRDIRPKPPKDPAAVPGRAADYLDSWERLYGEVRTLVKDFDRMGVTARRMREIAATTAAPQSMLRAAMRGDERAPSPITLSEWGQFPDSWSTPERLPLARAILAEWRRRYAER